MYSLEDLQPGVEYEVQVATINQAGYSDFTALETFKTASAASSIYVGSVSNYLINNFVVIILYKNVFTWWLWFPWYVTYDAEFDIHSI